MIMILIINRCTQIGTIIIIIILEIDISSFYKLDPGCTGDPRGDLISMC